MRPWLVRFRRRRGRAALSVALVLAAFAVTRAAAFAAAHAGALDTHGRFAGIWERRDADLFQGPAPSKLVEPLVRWDALYYVAIAREGYPPPRAQTVYHVNFFPLYPLLVRAVDSAIGNTFAAALLVSNLATIAAALLLALLSVSTRACDGTRAAILLLAAPGAHFLSLPYTEGLFALALGGAFIAMARHRPMLAGLCGAVAGATRSAGLAVALALGVSAIVQWVRNARRQAVQSAAAALLATSGIAAWSAWCASRYGDPLYWVHSQAAWGRKLSLLGPFKAFAAFETDPDYYLVAIAAIVALVYLTRRIALHEAVAGWFLLLLPMATGTLKALIRYQTVNLPIVNGAPRLLRGRRFWWAALAGASLMLLEAFLYGKGLAHH